MKRKRVGKKERRKESLFRVAGSGAVDRRCELGAEGYTKPEKVEGCRDFRASPPRNRNWTWRFHDKLPRRQKNQSFVLRLDRPGRVTLFSLSLSLLVPRISNPLGPKICFLAATSMVHLNSSLHVLFPCDPRGRFAVEFSFHEAERG